MTSDGDMRASDRDRDCAGAALREAYTAGRLDAEEFGERLDVAYAAKTWGELRDLTADLPEGAALTHRPAPLCSYQTIDVHHEPQRPFGQVWGTVAIWLIIAAVAHVFAAIPLVVLSAFVLVVTHWRDRRRPEDDQQQGGPDGS